MDAHDWKWYMKTFLLSVIFGTPQLFIICNIIEAILIRYIFEKGFTVLYLHIYNMKMTNNISNKYIYIYIYIFIYIYIYIYVYVYILYIFIYIRIYIHIYIKDR